MLARVRLDFEVVLVLHRTTQSSWSQRAAGARMAKDRLGAEPFGTPCVTSLACLQNVYSRPSHASGGISL